MRISPSLDGFWFTTADASRYAAWADAGAADWHAFLTARAAEMLPGARLVVVVGSAHGEGRARRSGAERAMAEIARGIDDLVVRGVLTAAERAAMTIPAWYRTADEWRAPFASAIGLELEHLDLIDIGDPLWRQTRDRPHEYAATAANALRVSFGPALLHQLPTTRRAALADALFDQHLAGAISTHAPEPWFDWRLAVMVIYKPAA